MRVALGTVYPYDESRVRGGVEAVALCLANALTKRGDIELHIVSCNRAVGRSFVERRGTVTFHWLATGKRFYGLRALTVDAWRVRRVYGAIRPDVIHAQGFSEYAVAARPHDRLVLTIHGVTSFVPVMRQTDHFRGPVGLYRRWIGNRIAQGSIRRASAIVSIAGDYIPQLLGTRLGRQLVYHIDNPISDAFFASDLAWPSSESIVLFAGTIIEHKNVVGLVGAFAQVMARIPEAKLQIAGAVGEPGYYARVQNEIALLRLQDRVVLLGALDQRSLLDAYARASVVALRSIHETTPVVLAQAMAMGKPVVATRVAGIPWMIEDGRTGYLVEVGDTDGFADRLEELLLDEPKRREMGQVAREVARQRFASDVVAEKTMRVYQELLGLRRGN